MNAGGPPDDPHEPVEPAEARQAAPETTPDAVERELADASIVEVRTNVRQTAFLIGEDRATLILNDLAEALARNRDWGTPLGLTIGFGMSLVTANFKSVAGISSDAVTAVVVLLTVAALLWTVVRVVQALRTPSRKSLVAAAIARMEDQDAGT